MSCSHIYVFSVTEGLYWLVWPCTPTTASWFFLLPFNATHGMLTKDIPIEMEKFDNWNLRFTFSYKTFNNTVILWWKYICYKTISILALHILRFVLAQVKAVSASFPKVTISNTSLSLTTSLFFTITSASLHSSPTSLFCKSVTRSWPTL